MYNTGTLTVAATTELDTACAAADCSRDAIPPATCMVPTPGTIVPNAAMAAGISSFAPKPAT